MLTEPVSMPGRADPSIRAAALVAIASLALLLACCQRRDAAVAKAQPHRTAEAGIDPAVLNAGKVMAAGVPIGTTTAPVDVRFNLGSVPRPGEPFALDVAVLPRGAVPLLLVDVRSSDGLAILEPTASEKRERVQDGSLVHVRVRASAATAGTYVVHVRTTLQLVDGSASDEFAFPVMVGEALPTGPPPAVPKPGP